MKRGEAKLSRGPKAKSFNPAPYIRIVLDPSQEKRLAESIAIIVTAKLRSEFAAQPASTTPADAPHA